MINKIELLNQKKEQLKELKSKLIYSGIKELDEIFSGTSNVFSFDEQKMLIVRKFGEFSLKEANKFRKKAQFIKETDYKQYEEWKTKFITTAPKYGLNKEKAEFYFEAMLGYSFCESHSVAYTLDGYWCAWFKVHYPINFMHAMFLYSRKELDSDKFNVKDAVIMSKRMGYTVIPADINKSKENFSFDDNNKIVFWALNHIKGINQGAKIIEKFQPYIDFNDFIEKTKLGKKEIYPLGILGAFNSLPNGIEDFKNYFIKMKW